MKEVYGECQRNHSAKLGTNTRDGCGEYMADDTTQRGLYCDACGCHRNFHKKIVVLVDSDDADELLEYEATASVGGVAYEPQQQQHAATLGGSTRANISNALTVKDEQHHSENQEVYATTAANNNTGNRNKHGRGTASSSSCYRRSRFSHTQKEKLTKLGFYIGWRMPTRSSPAEHEEAIRKLCNELEITRFVFKTWMNNQKKYHVQYSATSTPTTAPPGFS
ncbi:hypothetical protein MKW94_015704 [Papaver nudicaule]|uniref:ZF-HD dimerization-type domain-containing protein n=1 Tax=Papaver nudicaule TaxID=74823 RepID=A0AA41UW73_PAPNU|nr:hypothetical protein [Papaver nudicaule]